jgi:hypothetical protein
LFATVVFRAKLPEVEILVIAIAELPLFESVTVLMALVTLVAWFPKASDVGFTLPVGGRRPVPVNATVRLELAGSFNPEIVRLPVAGPAAVGENTTFMVQVALMPRLVVQVPPAAPVGRANGAVTLIPPMVSAASPVFDSVTVCAELVVPTLTDPKASDVGETVALGYADPATSTAPISICVPATSGLGLPKKSVDGATEYVGELVGTASTTGDVG